MYNNIICVLPRLFQCVTPMPYFFDVVTRMIIVVTSTHYQLYYYVRLFFYHQIALISLPGGEEKEFEITPMADAAVRGHLEIIEVIVEYGGQINAINEVS